MSLQYPPLIPEGQVPTEQYVRSWFAHLVAIFGQRNGEYKVLRSIYDGTYNTNIANTPSQDLKNVRDAHVGTPFHDRPKLIYNVANATIRRYMDSMSTPPQIEGVPEGFDMKSIELADKRTKFLEMVWKANDMPIKLIMASYYQSLMDKAIFNIRPAPHLKHKIKIDLAVPDYYLPITRGDDWQHPLAVIYGFRTFENADFLRNPMQFNGDPVFNTVIEYWDYHWFMRLENGKPPILIKHDMLFIPWYECHNLPIPHRYRGQGDVDQAVGLNEYLNILMSSMADMISYAANPIAVIRGTKVGGTNLPFEPRAVWELERDAQVGFLQWTGAPPSVEAQILRTIQAIEDVTGVSSPAFGREIPSGTSGQAVRSLLAGFNTRLGTKQQLLGEMLVKMNRGILRMAEQMYPDESFRVIGEKLSIDTAGNTVATGRGTYYTVQPKEFNGWHETKVVFAPIDAASTYFQAVDKYKSGLASKYTTLKALGVQNVGDELERIKIEKHEEAEHAQNLALAQQGQFVRPGMGGDNQSHIDNLQKMLSQLGPTGQSFAGGPGLRPEPGANAVVPGASPKALEQRKTKADLAKEVLKQNTQGGVSKPGADIPPTPESKLPEPQLSLNDVLAKLRIAGLPITGKAALTGELVTNAKADRGQMLLSNMQDANAIKNALGEHANKFDFKQIDPNVQLPQNSIIFNDPSKVQKKNRDGIRRLANRALNVVVTNIERTDNNATVYQIGVLDDRGSVVPIGKTDPMRGGMAEQGEVIRVKIGSLSARNEGGITKYGVGMASPLKTTSVPARPDTIATLAKIYGEPE